MTTVQCPPQPFDAGKGEAFNVRKRRKMRKAASDMYGGFASAIRHMVRVADKERKKAMEADDPTPHARILGMMFNEVEEFLLNSELFEEEGEPLPGRHSE